MHGEMGVGRPGSSHDRKWMKGGKKGRDGRGKGRRKGKTQTRESDGRHKTPLKVTKCWGICLVNGCGGWNCIQTHC